VALVAFWPSPGDAPNKALFPSIMFAPTAGALLAHFFAGARIQWGRPNLWILAGVIPSLTALGAYLLATTLGWVSLDSRLLWIAMAVAPLAIVVASLSAVGEEIGWRGFLWPTLRARFGFLRTGLIVFLIWWTYHVPMILFGWYGTKAGLPAFTLAIAGLVLFVGVLTDRARAMWPSLAAHGAWNALVATNFAVDVAHRPVPAFVGSPALLGEFGWLAAITTAILGGLTSWWHVTHPVQAIPTLASPVSVTTV
jgi:membrane protease YdiL (CAAX protease family)